MTMSEKLSRSKYGNMIKSLNDKIYEKTIQIKLKKQKFQNENNAMKRIKPTKQRR